MQMDSQTQIERERERDRERERWLSSSGIEPCKEGIFGVMKSNSTSMGTLESHLSLSQYTTLCMISFNFSEKGRVNVMMMMMFWPKPPLPPKCFGVGLHTLCVVTGYVPHTPTLFNCTWLLDDACLWRIATLCLHVWSVRAVAVRLSPHTQRDTSTLSRMTAWRRVLWCMATSCLVAD